MDERNRIRMNKALPNILDEQWMNNALPNILDEQYTALDEQRTA